MDDISIYFTPLQKHTSYLGEICSMVNFHQEGSFPELEKKGIAIMYVPEYRNSSQQINDSLNHIELIRDRFYELSKGNHWSFPIYDLGVVRPGERIEDTYFALSKIIKELVKKEIIPFVIGGSQDLTLACFKGFNDLEQLINVCNIDSKLDIGNPDREISEDEYIAHFLTERPCHLFNYSIIGVQRPFVKEEEISLFDNLNFDVLRLGELDADFKRAEPFLRNSDIISIDYRCLRASDVEGLSNPNGISSSHICQIARYAGVSDKLNCAGIFNLPEIGEKGASLIAQIIWYFIDGVENRVGDFPIGSKKNYTQFYVHIEDIEEPIVFYKSNKSDRWWIEVKEVLPDSKYIRHHLIPCDKKDYEAALYNNIPDLWWNTLKKMG